MSYQIFIRLNTGRHNVLEVSPETPVSDIKLDIHRRQGIPPEFQRLQYKRQYLTDNQTIGSLSIKREDTVILSVRSNSPPEKISARPSAPMT